MPTPALASRRLLVHGALAMMATLATGVPSAHGRSVLIRSTGAAAPGAVAQPVEGPVLGGGNVVWAEQASPGVWRLHDARAGQTARSASRTYPVGPAIDSKLDLVASRTRVAATASIPFCPRSLCPGESLERIVTWRFGDPPSTVVTCQDTACRSGCQPGYAPWQPALADDALAYIDRCADVIRIRDFAATEPAWQDIAPGHAVDELRAAGRFLAWSETLDSPRWALVVYDRVARQEAYRIDDPGGDWDIQEDGKVAFLGNGGLGWASPAHPEPQWIVRRTGACPLYPCPPEVDFGNRVRIGGDRIAVLRRPSSDRPSEVRVLGLDGSRLAHSRVDAAADFGFDGGFDFDGSFVVSAARPCQTTGISVWDIAEEAAPALARVACPAPGRGARAASLSAAGSVSAPLRCPRRPALGCVGTVHLVAFADGDHTPLATQRYSIPYGRTRTATTPRVSRKARRFLARHPDAMIMARMKSTPRYGVEHGDPSTTRYARFALRRP